MQNGTLQITAALLTATANDATRSYGAANPLFSGTMVGVVPGEKLAETFTTPATAASPVASYEIKPAISGAAAGNYNPTLKNGTLTVTPAGLTVTANNASRTYGAANPPFTGAITGAMNNEAFTESFTTSATQLSPVGTYAVVPTATGSTLSNYKQSVQNGSLSISPAALAVKANDASRAYGAANPSFTGTVTGMVNSDSFTETYTTSATPATAVGTYPIVPSAAGPNLGSYTQTLINGTLTITPAQLTASAGNSTRPYGGANPSFTGSVTGAANGEVFTETFTTVATAQSPVGTYAVTPAVVGPTLGSYQAVLVPGHLTVVPAPLTVTAANATRVYGAPNPALTGTLTGAVNGDTLTASYTTTAGTTDAPGRYPVVASVSGAGLGNYALTSGNGMLTIEKAGTTTKLMLETADGGRLLVQVRPVTAGVPTGTVQLLNGTQALGQADLVNGSASFASDLLPAAGATNVTASYAGDGNFLSSVSDALAVASPTPGFSVGPAAGAPATATATGGQATFMLQATPGLAGVYPGVVTFSVSGLPSGATAAFSPATLQPGSGAQVITLSVTVKSVSGTAPGGVTGRASAALGAVALAFAMLPLAGARRLRTSGRRLLLVCVLALTAVGSLGVLTGCGVTMEHEPSQAQPASYPLTIIMTSGGMSRTTAATLTMGQ